MRAPLGMTKLVCPACEKDYYVERKAIGEEGRRVRCEACSHAWTAYLQPGDELRSSRALPIDPTTGPTRSQGVRRARAQDVFLSYSSQDRKRAKQVRDCLITSGYLVVWDQDTPVGENWDSWIRSQLSAAAVVVVLWTKNSAASRNVFHEATIAADKLVPVILEHMEASDFPMGFYSNQAASLVKWNGQSGHHNFRRIVDAINERLLGPK